MLPTRLARVAAVAIAVVAVACADPTGTNATYANVLNSYTLYPLTNAPASVPNALTFLGGLTRANASFGFDVAFDLDAQGNVIVYPVRFLGSALAGTLKFVGLQQVAGSFDQVTLVPETGYDSVSVQTLAPGKVLVVQLRDATSCYASIKSQLIYAKLVVDSVNASHQIFTRTVIDPNCGFRDVVPDSVPKT
jgi:hypothetical protein